MLSTYLRYLQSRTNIDVKRNSIRYCLYIPEMTIRNLGNRFKEISSTRVRHGSGLHCPKEEVPKLRQVSYYCAGSQVFQWEDTDVMLYCRKAILGTFYHQVGSEWDSQTTRLDTNQFWTTISSMPYNEIWRHATAEMGIPEASEYITLLETNDWAISNQQLSTKLVRDYTISFAAGAS